MVQSSRLERLSLPLKTSNPCASLIELRSDNDSGSEGGTSFNVANIYSEAHNGNNSCDSLNLSQYGYIFYCHFR